MILLLVLITAPFTRADSGGIGISVKLDEKSIPTVTIVSDGKQNNATNLTVLEAVKKITPKKGLRRGSVDWVGIVVADDVRLDHYLPLLEAIAKNPGLMLLFVDGDDSEKHYVSKNIRRLIESGPRD